MFFAMRVKVDRSFQGEQNHEGASGHPDQQDDPSAKNERGVHHHDAVVRGGHQTADWVRLRIRGPE